MPGDTKPYASEFRVVRRDGTLRWAFATGKFYYGTSGDAERMLGMATDITERKQTEEALGRKDKELAEAQRLAGVGSWQWELQKDAVIWSKELYRLMGVDPTLPAPSFKEHGKLFTAESWERLERAVQEGLQTGTPYELDLEVVRPESIVKWEIARGEAVRDGGGQIIGLRGTVQDITERKRAEEALRESEQRLRLAIQAGRMYAFDWNVATDVIVRSKESAEILNWEKPETDTGTAFRARIHPDDLALYTATDTRLTAENPTYQIIFRMLNPAGSVIWLEDSGRAFFDGHGALTRVIGMVANITGRKQAEEALHESEERFRLAAQAGKMFAYEWDAATDKIMRSEGVSLILGPDAGPDTTGQEISAMVPPEDQAKLTAAMAQLTPEDPHLRISYRMVRSDGRVVWVERTSRAYFDEHGRTLRIVGMIADITERKAAEAALSTISRRLIEAQEQERIRIGRELHDDIGQRLALLAVELEQLREQPLVLPRVRSRLGKLQKQISEIAGDIQSLSHELHSAKLQYLGLAAAMRGFCREFSEQQKAEVDFKAHDVPGALSTDISLNLFRVLQEALHNSAKHSGVRHFEVRLWGTPDEIHLTVKDSGAGFEREAAKEGRGIGLISMEERLKLVNGTLSIESRLKGGTAIYARVPLDSGSDSMRAAG